MRVTLLKAPARFAVALLALGFSIAASPPPAAAPPPQPPTAAPARDRSTQLIGTWRCSAFPNDAVTTQTYARTPDGATQLSEAPETQSDPAARTAPTGNATARATTFAYEAQSRVWQRTEASQDASLTAPPWTSDEWIFIGREGARKRSHSVRIVYTDLGPLAYRWEHQVEARGMWSADAEAVCKRTSPLPTPAPPSRMAHAGSGRPGTGVAGGSSGDRAYHLLGGTWTCETVAGNPGTQRYERLADGSFALRTRLRLPRGLVVIDESFRYDRVRKTWSTVTQGNAYRGTAPPWVAQKWVFAGVLHVGRRDTPVRMVYTDLQDRAYRRDFKTLHSDVWETFTSETCAR